MKVELLIIGNEILKGMIQDLNTKGLAHRLMKRGYYLERVQIVQDELHSLQYEIAASWKRSDAVILSGGLGPTEDDLTKKALALAFDGPIKFNQAAAEVAKKNYLRFGKNFTSALNGYDHIPEGFIPIDNPTGLAPGLCFQQEDKFLLAAPGVPREFNSMIDETFLPFLENKTQHQSGKKAQINIRTKLIPEEKIFGELCPDLWEQLATFGQVFSLPKIMGIDIGVTYEASKKYEQEIKNIFLSSPLKENIWHIGDQDIAEVILDQLKSRKLTLSCAESCTGGLIASKLTDVPGSSQAFMGSAVCYSNQAKMNLLGVPEDIIQNKGAVSTETVEAMALGAQSRYNTDWAVATSGIAGPGGGSESKPVGTVAIAVVGPDKKFSHVYQLSGDRLKLKERFCQMAFYNLLELLIA